MKERFYGKGAITSTRDKLDNSFVTHLQVYKLTSLQAYKRTSLQAYKLIYKLTILQAYKFTSLQVYKLTSLQLHFRHCIAFLKSLPWLLAYRTTLSAKVWDPSMELLFKG